MRVPSSDEIALAPSPHVAGGCDDDVERLRFALSTSYGGAPVRLDGPISVRDYSRIFHAAITLDNRDQPLRVAVKQCIDPLRKIPDAAEANLQYAALERVDSALAGGKEIYRVPTPLKYFPELAAYAMSWVDGTSLTRKMRFPSVFVHGERWFSGCGAWLGHFHAAGPCQKRSIDLEQQLGVIERLRAAPIVNRSFARAIDVLLYAVPSISGLSVSNSWLHGDCKTDNFILHDADVYGIDLSLSYQNAVEYDIAQFLNHFSLVVLSPQLIYLRSLRKRLETAFQRGYLRHGPRVSTAYLDWLRLVFAITFWHNTLEDGKGGLRVQVLNTMFSRLAAELANAVARNSKLAGCRT